jgi:hypothetical protein
MYLFSNQWVFPPWREKRQGAGVAEPPTVAAPARKVKNHDPIERKASNRPIRPGES